MLRRLGRTIGSLVLGLLTSAVIFLGTLVIAERVLAPVRLPSGVEVFTNMWDYGVVSASGTWTIEGYGHGTPLNHVKISCHREDKTCVMAQATVDSNTMSADIYNHAIEKWDASAITYKTDAGCTNYVYTIDRANKRVIGTRTKKPNAGEQCSIVEARPLSLTLSDGFEVSRRLGQEAMAVIYPFLWTGLALWWVFVCVKIWRVWRKPA
jgi:hypothetical protein